MTRAQIEADTELLTDWKNKWNFEYFEDSQYEDAKKYIKDKYLNYVKEITDIFDHFDEDKSGTLEIQEIRKVFAHLKIDIKEADIENCIKDIDTDHNENISPEEFI